MTTTLTKLDIVEIMAEKMRPLGFKKNQCSDSVDSLIEIMKNTLENGEDLLVSGFGKFCVKQKSERRGRNPATSEAMMLSSRKVVTFKCSGKLRDKVNGVDKRPSKRKKSLT